MKIKKVVPVAIAFCAGFVAHMFLFSDILPETFMPNRPTTDITKKTGAAGPTPEFAKSAVYIEYKDGSFHPKTTTSKVGNHVLVRNMDKDHAMWLVSDVPDFISTPRPYGLSEQVDQVPHKAGTFVVKNKLNEGASFTVIVKP